MLHALTKCDVQSWCHEIEEFNATMTRYGNFDIILDHFSLFFQRSTTLPHTRRVGCSALVPVLAGG